ncbi:MAG: SH3 domain-containing protein [Chitinophagaceae bacterium]|nr:SH3 domain-containing protein [Chitinophagaceae bacterium]
MRIENHTLVADAGEAAIPVLNSPNKGSTITPKHLVIHYTAGRSAQSSVDWFMKPGSDASAHVVIGMDGKITQVVPFNKKAFHAGESKWNGLTGLNSHSIGIELDNPGLMTKTGTKWFAWFGKEYPSSVVIEAKHKNENVVRGWHIFSEKQIEACVNVSKLLMSHYQLGDIVGHDDIAPFRKTDPGPAFPMESFKSKVLGRRDDAPTTYTVNTENTNLRAGPGMEFSILAQLKKGTKVELMQTQLNWYNVLVVTRVTGLNEPEGWVHKNLLTKD